MESLCSYFFFIWFDLGQSESKKEKICLDATPSGSSKSPGKSRSLTCCRSTTTGSKTKHYFNVLDISLSGHKHLKVFGSLDHLQQSVYIGVQNILLYCRLHYL